MGSNRAFGGHSFECPGAEKGEAKLRWGRGQIARAARKIPSVRGLRAHATETEGVQKNESGGFWAEERGDEGEALENAAEEDPHAEYALAGNYAGVAVEREFAEVWYPNQGSAECGSRGTHSGEHAEDDQRVLEFVWARAGEIPKQMQAD